MLSYLKWTFWILFWGAVLLFLHYTLPRYDVVRIADTYSRRIDFGDNSIFWANPPPGSATGSQQGNRDVFFLQTIRANGKPMVYRNEDTGFGWPPFFKFDTTSLQAEAADLRSTAENPTWVAVLHYGWRVEMLSIFPNALAVRELESKDDRPVAWFSWLFLAGFVALVWFVWGRLRRLRRRRIDPFLDDTEESWDEAERRMKSWWRF